MSDHSVEDQFSGLDMHNLIGAPLNAILKAQAEAAETTADFIERVGVPLLELAPVPAFTMDEATVDLAMEVKEKLPPED